MRGASLCLGSLNLRVSVLLDLIKLGLGTGNGSPLLLDLAADPNACRPLCDLGLGEPGPSLRYICLSLADRSFELRGVNAKQYLSGSNRVALSNFEIVDPSRSSRRYLDLVRRLDVRHALKGFRDGPPDRFGDFDGCGRPAATLPTSAATRATHSLLGGLGTVAKSPDDQSGENQSWDSP